MVPSRRLILTPVYLMLAPSSCCCCCVVLFPAVHWNTKCVVCPHLSRGCHLQGGVSCGSAPCDPVRGMYPPTDDSMRWGFRHLSSVEQVETICPLSLAFCVPSVWQVNEEAVILWQHYGCFLRLGRDMAEDAGFDGNMVCASATTVGCIA